MSKYELDKREQPDTVVSDGTIPVTLAQIEYNNDIIEWQKKRIERLIRENIELTKSNEMLGKEITNLNHIIIESYKKC